MVSGDEFRIVYCNKVSTPAIQQAWRMLMESQPLEALGGVAASALKAASIEALGARPHGLWGEWLAAISAMPPVAAADMRLDCDAVSLVSNTPLSKTERERLQSSLRILRPWRKGPFDFFGVEVDAEWRSHLKWHRLAAIHHELQGKHILDVGCGNGYYALRMLGAGARFVLAIDPSQLFIAQHLAVKKYVPHLAMQMLPLGDEALPLGHLQQPDNRFDVVFSMGVLYHRKHPLAHLRSLRRCLARNGFLILETLVLRGDGNNMLVPRSTYAKMPNVRGIPTIAYLHKQLAEAGFSSCEILDITPTTTDEQRSTPWMPFQSLGDFLNAQDHSVTIEGYPAPLRALVRCEA